MTNKFLPFAACLFMASTAHSATYTYTGSTYDTVSGYSVAEDCAVSYSYSCRGVHDTSMHITATLIMLNALAPSTTYEFYSNNRLRDGSGGFTDISSMTMHDGINAFSAHDTWIDLSTNAAGGIASWNFGARSGTGVDENWAHSSSNPTKGDDAGFMYEYDTATCDIDSGKPKFFMCITSESSNGYANSVGTWIREGAPGTPGLFANDPVSSVPLPASLPMLVVGLLALGYKGRARNQA